MAQFVQSCEHDETWFRTVRSQLPQNAAITYRALPGDDYVAEIATGGPWDIAMVDGRQRAECALTALEHLSERGVVVWDDTGRAEYDEGLRAVVARGFSRVDFHGLKPCSRREHSTSILYRSGQNLLGL
jgi:hypothetical protein